MKIKSFLKGAIICLIIAGLLVGIVYCSFFSRKVWRRSLDLQWTYNWENYAGRAVFTTDYKATGLEIKQDDDKVSISFDSFEGTLVYQIVKRTFGKERASVEISVEDGRGEFYGSIRKFMQQPQTSWGDFTDIVRPAHELGTVKFLNKIIIVIQSEETYHYEGDDKVYTNHTLKNGQITVRFENVE